MSFNSKKDNSDSAEMVTVDELRMAPTSDSPRKAIKSTAVVKYSAVEAPACFEQLRCNTDLNEPPSNWLSPKSCGGIHHGLSNNSGFSSFRMAHMFPDCVGEVDVVSDAENIKKLLKIPYSKGPVSMMVHRVENTLLIDEFDVHKHLLRTSEWDWRWLRSFFFEHVLTSLSCKDKGLYQKGISRGALQQKSLVSKFLYHSIGSEGLVAEGPDPTTSSSSPPEQTSPTPWATLPEPQPVLPDTKSADHEFARNLLWTFEDIQMLIGTDMPIFGGSTHPCISLRLRDMNKPISVLTGIDYWLDNLMCNVPEVVMCYHLDGIVQRYELVKTEDLPHMEDSKFSPKLIHDVAQNILSFLKSNATKAGHTYWLFKGKDDDAVKLYDLSSLCGEDMEEQGQNPFTVPVAILLYRVARNMKQQGSTQLGCIRTLLQNCVSLLDKEKYPQIVTSAHYMLSDLYVPSETNPSKPELPEDQGDDEQVEEEDELLDRELEQTGETSVEVQSLVVTDSNKSIRAKCHLAPLCGSNKVRCREALKHVAQGLQCLRLLDTRMWHKDNEKSSNQEEEEPKMAHPFQPIPMPFTEPTKESLAVSTTHEKEVMKGPNKKTDSENNWTGHLLTLLYEKALLVLAILVQESLGAGNFGTVLTQVQHVLNLLSGLKKLADLLGMKNARYKEMTALRSILLGQAGDACSLIVQKWSTVDQFREEMLEQDSEVNVIFEQLEMDIGPQEDAVIISSNLESMQDVLRSGVNVYKLALDCGPSVDTEASLRRRLGNAHNELGVLYMSLATSKLTEGEKSEFESLVHQSLGELEAGIVAFQCVADNGNLALLLSNTGRLMRLCAHALSKSSGSALGTQERSYYTKAVNYYQKALSTLGTRKSTENCAIWDSVSWELSTTLFNMAATLQDFPNCHDKSQEQLEREVGDALQKALQACDLETPGPRLPIYQFRAATLHHRLASLHHSSFRQLSGEDPRRKFALQLCRLHYEKSANMLKSLEDHTEHLRVQLERVALSEFIAEGSSNVNLRRKNLHAGLELLVACESAVKGLTSSHSPDTKEEELRLLKLLEQRLQCLLLSMAKLTAPPTTSKTTKNKENVSPNYKAMYAATLHRVDNANPEDVPNLASRLASQLQHISELVGSK